MDDMDDGVSPTKRDPPEKKFCGQFSYVLWRLAMGLAEDEEDNIDYPLVI